MKNNTPYGMHWSFLVSLDDRTTESEPEEDLSSIKLFEVAISLALLFLSAKEI